MEEYFIHIVNHMRTLVFFKWGFDYKSSYVIKLQLKNKVTTISESRELSSTNLATLFGKLLEHEMELKKDS